jgi:site-specific DNA-methyltransferase (adenine-specific)
VWDKKLAGNFLNANKMPLMVHEMVHVFMPGGICYNPQMTKGQRRGKGDKNGNVSNGQSAYGSYGGNYYINDDYYPTSILSFSNGDRTNSDNGLHSTQKPVALLEYLVKTYTNPGDTILDCTMGSCSTGKAAVKNGRSFVGIDNGYCEKEDSEYYGWSWVDYAHVALANIAGDFIRTPAEKATGQMSLLLEAG